MLTGKLSLLDTELIPYYVRRTFINFGQPTFIKRESG